MVATSYFRLHNAHQGKPELFRGIRVSVRPKSLVRHTIVVTTVSITVANMISFLKLEHA